MTRFRWYSALLLLVSGAVLYVYPASTLFIAAVFYLHLAAGVLLLLALLPALARILRHANLEERLGWTLIACGGLLGVALMFTGAARPFRALLYAHMVSSMLGAVCLFACWLGHAPEAAARRMAPHGLGTRLAASFLVIAGLSAIGWWIRVPLWQRSHVITNPEMPPDSMEGEGDGPRGPFFPSSAQTAHGGTIPAKYFMQSDTCERCHADIYQQWSGSMHRFSSFNNQWYRKSIEYMQEVNGVQSSKWCAGCHDPAMLFTGLFERPAVENLHRPEAHAGLGCVMCHSMVKVKSTMGQGDFGLEYPQINELATSENPLLRGLHDFFVRVNPEPHRRTFMKPFVRAQTAEFCSSCHKVHLDVPVNNYRWIRGFNDYDNWQASGVSGQGARSFYYPAQPQKCVDCHMPLVPSQDLGNVDGRVHSHRFPGANTAVPFANQDWEQFQATADFLRDGQLTVDIFALSPARELAGGGEARPADLMTTFAIGEEAEPSITPGGLPVAPVTAPLNRVAAVVRRGDEVLVDVVVRTRKVGHFFPGGTVDAFDVWVELQATDDKGQVLFWSGTVDDGGKGPVEKGAHFYRSLMVDANGNWINKRNAWATRAVVYVRLIPPGAADTVHYRMRIPEDAGEKITLRARLHYRKFMWWNTQFAFAGVPDPAQPKAAVTPHYDDRRFVFTGDTSGVSGRLKHIPDLPIITLASDEVTIGVAPRSAPAPHPKVALHPDDWTRWNDYGIGLLLQGDLRAAEAAFEKITAIDPRNPEGWNNIGRVRVAEGNLEGAREVLRKALELQPDLASAQYFYARVLKSEGQYDQAAAYLQRALQRFPRDRVVRNELGRVRFLQRRYADAIVEFKKTLAIDPEDLAAHYNLMLSYHGLGDTERALAHQKRYLRFKADESAQAITGPYRRAHPEDNNERQAIHEHVSVSPARIRAALAAQAAAPRARVPQPIPAPSGGSP
jgi:tetratricopeptide (TPR) repeat protein